MRKAGAKERFPLILMKNEKSSEGTAVASSLHILSPSSSVLILKNCMYRAKKKIEKKQLFSLSFFEWNNLFFTREFRGSQGSLSFPHVSFNEIRDENNYKNSSYSLPHIHLSHSHVSHLSTRIWITLTLILHVIDILLLL